MTVPRREYDEASAFLARGRLAMPWHEVFAVEQRLEFVREYRLVVAQASASAMGKILTRGGRRTAVANFVAGHHGAELSQAAEQRASSLEVLVNLRIEAAPGVLRDASWQPWRRGPKTGGCR